MKKRIMSVLSAGILGAGAVFATAAPANASDWEGGGVENPPSVITHYLTYEEVVAANNAGSVARVACTRLPAGYSHACQAAYTLQWPSEFSDAMLRGCDLYQRTTVNTSDTTSWNRSSTTYTPMNCSR